MYKTVLCKYCWTASKIRVMGIRAMGNRVRRGMTVYIFFGPGLFLIFCPNVRRRPQPLRPLRRWLLLL